MAAQRKRWIAAKSLAVTAVLALSGMLLAERPRQPAATQPVRDGRNERNGRVFYVHTPKAQAAPATRPATARAYSDTRVFLWFHGGGMVAKTQFDWWMNVKGIADNWILLCPEAKESNRGWDPQRDGAFVEEILSQTIKDYSVAPANVIVGGFSQGGSMASSFAFQNQDRIAGLMACACVISQPIPKARSKMVIMYYYSMNDPYYSMARPDEAQKAMETAGYHVSVVKDNVGHDMGPKAPGAFDSLREATLKAQVGQGDPVAGPSSSPSPSLPASSQPASAPPIVRAMLRNTNPLRGGCNVYVRGDGRAVVDLYSPGKPQPIRRYEVALNVQQVQELAELIQKHRFFELKLPERPGRPDEHKQEITVIMADGRERTLVKWAADSDADFGAMYGWFRSRTASLDNEKPAVLPNLPPPPDWWTRPAALGDTAAPAPATTAATKAATAPAGLSFTYLVADAVNFGSSAFRIGGDGAPLIYIEAFPKRAACQLDPAKITTADLIIQNVHGHTSHYDADTCAQVALKTGALVLGNDLLKKDMLARNVPAEKIITLNARPNAPASTTLDALKIKVTAYRMEHTMMPKAFVDTFLVEMPDGTRWYHGTCSSGPNAINRMAAAPELKNLDVMILDCDMPFAEIAEKLSPRAMIRDHDFMAKARPAPATVYTAFPEATATLTHGQTWILPPRKAQERPDGK